MFSQFKLGLFAIFTGSSGLTIAALKPWQDHIEWSLRIALLVLSIASVIVGLVLASRSKKPPRPLD
jgi:uncharacterized membrane protein YfcA